MNVTYNLHTSDEITLTFLDLIKLLLGRTLREGATTIDLVIRRGRG